VKKAGNINNVYDCSLSSCLEYLFLSLSITGDNMPFYWVILIASYQAMERQLATQSPPIHFIGLLTQPLPEKLVMQPHLYTNHHRRAMSWGAKSSGRTRLNVHILLFGEALRCPYKWAVNYTFLVYNENTHIYNYVKLEEKLPRSV